MSVLSTLPAGTYNIDPSHSRVGFSARHAMVTKVRGAFNEYTGSAVVADGAASISIEISAASVDTRSADRDGHLQSGDFFDVANFPKITFKYTQRFIVLERDRELMDSSNTSWTDNNTVT